MTVIGYTDNVKTDAGTYRAKAIFSYDTNMAEPVSAADWIIKKKVFDTSGIVWGNTTFTYDGNPHTVTLSSSSVLPAGLTFVCYTDNTRTAAGTYVAKAVFSHDSNYEEPAQSSVQWVINKATYDMSGVSWTGANFTYDGSSHSVTLSSTSVLPPGLTFTGYTGNVATNAGHYVATATFSYDSANYNNPASLLNWAIDMATYPSDMFEWGEREFTYDGATKSTKLAKMPSGVEATYDGNEAVNAGTYRASVHLQSSNPNYRVPDMSSFEWIVKKASVPVPNPGVFELSFTVTGIPVYSGNVTSDPSYSSSNVQLRYFSDRECTIEVAHKDLSAGTYWVIAKSTMLTNYNDVLSGPAEYTIYPVDDPTIFTFDTELFLIISLFMIFFLLFAVERRNNRLYSDYDIEE